MMQLLGHLQHWVARLGGPRPLRDWMIIVVPALLLLVGTTLWSWQLFQTVLNGGVIDPRVEVSKDGGEEVSSRTRQVRVLYKARTDEAAMYGADTYVVTDPSQ